MDETELYCYANTENTFCLLLGLVEYTVKFNLTKIKKAVKLIKKVGNSSHQVIF